VSVLAIDQGTSGTKALVVDDDGTVRGLADVTLRSRALDGRGVEQDPRALFDSVLTAGRRALAEAGRPVAAVALANQGETVLAWDDASGEALSPAMVWQDRRAMEICRPLAGHAPWVAERTGLVLDPYFSAPKLAWLRRHGTGSGVVTTTDAWLVHRLTGRTVTDVTTASRSLLLDLDRRIWDEELVDLFGLTGERLPEIVRCDEVVGTTDAFGPSLRVTGLVVDQQAALVAEGCLASGTAKCTYGTGAFLLATVGKKAVRSTAGLTTSVAWQTAADAAYCIDGQVYTVASAVRWLIDLGLIGSARDLDAVAGAASAGSGATTPDAGGVVCVPAHAGLAAPWWRPEARAVIAGIGLATGREQLVLAVLQGIAAQVRRLADCVARDLGGPLRALRVDGGLTRSAVLLQAQADLLQVPVEVYPSPHATALGAAALARLGIGAARDLADAVPPWQPDRVVEPRWPADRTAEFLARWSEVADAC